MPIMDTELRRRSRLLAFLITLVLVALTFAVVVEFVAAARGRFEPHYIALRLPVIFYLSAVWSARGLVLAVGQGAGHDRQLATLLRRIGIALFLGGICAVFVAPWIARLIRGGGSYAYYDVAAITVGVVGLALLVVAHLLGEAAAMRRELDEII